MVGFGDAIGLEFGVFTCFFFFLEFSTVERLLFWAGFLKFEFSPLRTVFKIS